MKAIIKEYYLLTKPGIIRGNILTLIGGYLYGAILRPQYLELLAVIFGTACVIASACVLNNIYDRKIDKKMSRTKNRALVTGVISIKSAVIFSVVLLIIGATSILLVDKLLTLLLGITALISYTVLYTPAKHRTHYATFIGTLPGAIPPVAGYAAATEKLDISALILFLILVAWQMVHFYAIAIFRRKEYQKAQVPVLPITHGILRTKLEMTIYVLLFVVFITLLPRLGYAGLIYLAVMGPLAIWWAMVTFSGFYTDDDDAWAKKVFVLSLLLLPLFCIVLGVNAYVP